MEVWSERLKIARERKNLKQTQVRDRTGIHNKTLSGYERGISQPDLQTLIRLADLYEVSIDYLVGRTDNPKMQFSKEERFIYDKLDLTDEEIMNQVDMYYDGMKLTEQEKKEFLAIVRGIFSVRRASK